MAFIFTGGSMLRVLVVAIFLDPGRTVFLRFPLNLGEMGIRGQFL